MRPGLTARLTGSIGTLRLDIDLTLPPSGVTVLTGPSGSGKSTLIRALAGLTRLKGEIRVGADTWQDEQIFRPTHRRAVGVVFQDARLLSHLDVRGNLTFGLKRAPAPPAIHLDAVVDLMGLDHLMGRGVHHLSGGEQQRVAIARALLTQPQVLLMDEPLSGLDPDSKMTILPYLQTLHRSLSIPVLYVAHGQDEIAAIADRIARLSAGRLVSLEDAAPAGMLAGRSREDIEALAVAALQAGLQPPAGI
ncbi:MAG: ABC transporter [Phenylobacterium zucineum]|nr:MAG: ABC transporter [Phenylobacterium zucineum]